MLRKLKNKIKTLIKLVRIKLFGVPKTVKYRGFSMRTIKNTEWSKRVYLTGQYSYDDDYEFEIMNKYINEGDIVFDVGAFVGTHTLIMTGLVGDSGEVYTFEPQKRCSDMINKNIEDNQIDNCNIFTVSVGAGEGETKLRTADIPNATSNTVDTDPWDKLEKYEIVEKIRIDKVINRNNIEKVDFMKIDVQGAEAEVIEGIGERIKDVRSIYMEIHSKYISDVESSVDKIMKLLDSNGKVFRVDEGRKQRITHKSQIVFDNKHPSILWLTD
jgi:FkbM family methyltransferase